MLGAEVLHADRLVFVSLGQLLVVSVVADEDHLDGVNEHDAEGEGERDVVDDEGGAAGAAAVYVHGGEQEQRHRRRSLFG